MPASRAASRAKAASVAASVAVAVAVAVVAAAVVAVADGGGGGPNMFQGLSTTVIRGGIGEFRGKAPTRLFTNALDATGLPGSESQLVCIGIGDADSRLVGDDQQSGRDPEPVSRRRQLRSVGAVGEQAERHDVRSGFRGAARMARLARRAASHPPALHRERRRDVCARRTTTTA